ncbi:MAG: NUDIX hydrolase, partial [Archaeoglobales archaeon]
VGSDALEARWVHFDEIKNLNVVDFVRRLVERIRSGKGGIYLR